MKRQNIKSKKRMLGVSAACALLFVGCAGFWLWGGKSTANASEYGKLMESNSTEKLDVTEDINLSESLVVNGDKTVTVEDGNKLTLEGNVTVKSGATLTIEGNVEVDANGSEHGIIVEKGATVVLTGGTLSNCNNGIQNNGTVTATNVHIKDSKNNGVYNTGKFTGTNVTIENVGNLGINNNGGNVEINGVTVKGTLKKAVYNTGSAKISSATIDGTSGPTSVENATEGYLVDNNGGTLELTSTTVQNANITAIGNRNGAKTTVSNVTVDNATEHGVLVDDGSSSVTGSDLMIKTGCKNAIYNKGKMEVKNLTIKDCTSGINCRYNGWAALSGTVSVENVTGNPVRIYGPEDKDYKNGVTLVAETQMTIDTAKGHGVNNKGSFLAAANSSLTVKNITGTQFNAINNNGGTMTLGDVVVDGVHVTINKYTDTTDGNKEKINTNSGNGIMNNGTLTINGHVEISNLSITPEDGLTDNSNCTGVVVKNGGTIKGKGSITVNGPETIDSTSTKKTLYNGVYVEDTKFALEGEVKVSGASNQGIMMAEKNVKMNVGALTVLNSGGNGIYINHTNGALNVSGDITIDGAKTNGINNNAGADITAHNISVSNITGSNGIANGTGGTIEVRHDIKIENISGATTAAGQGNGISIGSGIIEAGGNVTVTGITTSGNTDNSSNNGITGKGSLFVDGNVKVDGVTAGHGIFLNTTGVIHAYGDVTVNNVVKEGKQGIYLADATGKNICNLTAVNITVTNVGGNGIRLTNHKGNTFVSTGTVKVSGVVKGRGIQNEGGTMSAKNIEVSDIQANYNGIENKGSINVTGSSVKVSGITNGGHGIYNEGVFRTTASCTTTITSINGAKENGIHVAKGSVKLGNVVINGITATSTTDTKAGNGIYNAGTLQLDGTVLVNNVKNSGKSDHTNGAGIVNASGAKITGKGSVTVGSATDTNDTFYNGIFLDASSMKLKGDVAVYHSNNQGIYIANENAAFGARNVTVDTAKEQCVLVNKTTGAFEATGAVTLSNAKRGMQSYGTVEMGSVAVSNTTGNGFWVRGGKITVTGALSVNTTGEHGMAIGASQVEADSITIENITARDGIELTSAGKVKANTITIKNITARDGISMKGGSTVEAGMLTLENIYAHGIRVTDANTIKADALVVNTTKTENGLWISNGSENPTITIGNLVLYGCANRGVAASNGITNANLNVGTVWYLNCTNSYKSDNVDANCFGKIKENQIPEI